VRNTRAMRFSSVTAAATGVALAAIFLAVCAPVTDARGVVAAKKQEMDYYEGILHACPVLAVVLALAPISCAIVGQYHLTALLLLA